MSERQGLVWRERQKVTSAPEDVTRKSSITPLPRYDDVQSYPFYHPDVFFFLYYLHCQSVSYSANDQCAEEEGWSNGEGNARTGV